MIQQMLTFVFSNKESDNLFATILSNFFSPNTDYKTGFGGQFGVQTDRVDKTALGWDHKEKLQAHESQKDYKTGSVDRRVSCSTH